MQDIRDAIIENAVEAMNADAALMEACSELYSSPSDAEYVCWSICAAAVNKQHELVRNGQSLTQFTAGSTQTDKYDCSIFDGYVVLT